MTINSVPGELDYDRNSASVVLPISGKSATIYEATGFIERAFMRGNSRRPNWQAAPDFLVALVTELDGKKPTKKDILDLYVPDQEFLLVEAYKLNFGDSCELRLECQRCHKPHEHAFDLNDLVMIPVPDGCGDPMNPTVQGVLPRTGKSVVVGLLTGKQEARLLEAAEKTGIDLSLGDFEALRSFDGTTHFVFPQIQNLPLADHKAIRQLKRKLVCGYDTNITFNCPEPGCDWSLTLNILLHPDFFSWGG